MTGEEKYKLGLKEYRAQNYEKAGNFFQESLELDDSNHKVWNALGICCSKLGQVDNAATCFDNAISLDPSNQTYQKNQINNEKSNKSQKKGINEQNRKDSDKFYIKYKDEITGLLAAIGLIANISILFFIAAIYYILTQEEPIGELKSKVTPIFLFFGGAIIFAYPIDPPMFGAAAVILLIVWILWEYKIQQKVSPLYLFGKRK